MADVLLTVRDEDLPPDTIVIQLHVHDRDLPDPATVVLTAPSLPGA